MFSAVDRSVGAREPDLGAGQLSFLSALLSQDSTYSFCCHPKLSLPFLPAGVGRARGGGGGVCGMSVCGPESDVRVFALRLFHNIEG